MKKKLWASALVLGIVAGAIEVAARLNVRHEQKTRDYLGDQLYTETRGQGDPVVFLAGLQGSTEFWQDAFDPLSASHRLIFVDALGFGRSPWPDVKYTLDDHLAALRRTLVQQGATRNVTIVAHSFGTILGSYYAARYPGEVKRLVLLGTPVFSGEADARRRIREISPIAALFSLNRGLAREGCMVMGAFRPVLKKTLPSLKPDLPARVVSDAVLHSWPAIDGTIQNVLLTKPVEAPLRKLTAHVVFIHGTADGITPLSSLRALAHEIGAQLLVTPDKHLSYVTRSAATIRAAIRGLEAAVPL